MPASAVGCVVAAVGMCAGFAAWLHGARPGLRGGFEGQRDWSLLYVELPVMLIGVPAIAVAACTVTNRVLRRRAGRSTRAAASGGVAVLTLVLLAWACRAWLDLRVDAFLPGDA